MRFVAPIVAAVALVFSAGCITNVPVQLADSTIPLTPGSYTVIQEDVQGDAHGTIIFGIALSEPLPMKRARDRALEDSGADALINVAVDYRVIQIGPVVLYTASVTGDAVQVNP